MAGKQFAAAEPAAVTAAIPAGRGKGTAVRTAPAPAAAQPEGIGAQLHNLRFGLREQIAYHGAREIFLSRLGRFLTAVQVLLGTSAVAMMRDVFPDYSLATVVLAALTGVLLLVLDPFGAAREHRILRGRFHELFADCEEAECTPEIIRSLNGKMQRVMASAPPAYRAVQAIAFNMAVNATFPEEYAAKHRYRIIWPRRLFANWFAMRGMRFKREE